MGWNDIIETLRRAGKPTTAAPARMRPNAKIGPPLPVVYGKGRVKPSPVFFYPFLSNNGNFFTQAYNGKIGDVQFALCEAPVSQVTRVWIDREVFLPVDFNRLIHPSFRSPTSGASVTVSVDGNAPVWYRLDPTSPDYGNIDSPTGPYALANGMALRGVCWVGVNGVELVDGKLRDISFEVVGRCASGDGTAHPADVAVDLWENVLGFPVGTLDVEFGANRLASSSFRRYCTAMNWRVGRVIEDRQEAARYFDELMIATNSMPVQSTNAAGSLVIRLVPLGDTNVPPDGSGYVAPSVAYLTDADEILNTSDNPVEVERTPESDVFNVFPISIKRLDADFEDGTFEEPDRAHQSIKGPRRAGQITNGWIQHGSHARQISSLLAIRSTTARNKFKDMLLGPRWTRLEPGDLLSVTEEAGFGLAGKTVLITNIKETGKLERSVEAIEWPAGVGSTLDLTPQPHDGFETPLPPIDEPGYSADPGDATAPKIVMAPYLFGRDSFHVVVATSGGDEWGGARCEVSWDGGTLWEWVADIEGKATYGTLSAILPAGDSHDVTNSAAVVLTSGEFLPSSDEGRDGVAAPIYIDGEIVGYKTATGSTLSDLRRGAFGTSRGSPHAIGSTVIDLSTAGTFTVLPERLDTPMKLRLRSFNRYGRMTQPTVDDTYDFTPTAVDPPLPATCSLQIVNATELSALSAGWSADFRAAQYRELLGDNHSTIIGGTSPTIVEPIFAVVIWTVDPIYPQYGYGGAMLPAELPAYIGEVSTKEPILSGFAVAYYTGPDADAQSQYVRAPVNVGSNITSAVVRIPSAVSGVSFSAAVQSLYYSRTRKSAWRNSAGEVDLDPETWELPTQDDVDAAMDAATTALTLIGSKTRVFYANQAPITGMQVNDLWYNLDTSTVCPDQNCKGHPSDGNGDPLVGSYGHRGRFVAHRYTVGGWVSAKTETLILASEIAAGSITAFHIEASEAVFQKVTFGFLGPLATRNLVENPLTAEELEGLGPLATRNLALNPLTAEEITGLGALATQDTVGAGSVTGLGPLATRNTAVNPLTAAEIQNLGPYATRLTPLTPGEINGLDSSWVNNTLTTVDGGKITTGAIATNDFIEVCPICYVAMDDAICATHGYQVGIVISGACMTIVPDVALPPIRVSPAGFLVGDTRIAQSWFAKTKIAMCKLQRVSVSDGILQYGQPIGFMPGGPGPTTFNIYWYSASGPYPDHWRLRIHFDQNFWTPGVTYETMLAFCTPTPWAVNSHSKAQNWYVVYKDPNYVELTAFDNSGSALDMDGVLWGVEVMVIAQSSSYPSVPTGANIVSRPVTPTSTGQQLTLTGTATGSVVDGAPTPAHQFEYRFFRYGPGDGGWVVIREWGVRWMNTTPGTPGTYQYSVHVRRIGDLNAANWGYGGVINHVVV